MEKEKTSFTFETDNLSEKEDAIRSPIFASSSGCEWCVEVDPKGVYNDDRLSVYLEAANPESLRPGWIIRAISRFSVWDKSGTELFEAPEVCRLFCADAYGWGFETMLPQLQGKSFLEENKLIIKGQVQVVEVGHDDEGEVRGEEMVDVNGFQVHYTHVRLVSRIFAEHPGFEGIFGPDNQMVKTKYMNVLLRLIETLRKPHESLSETELSKALIDYWSEMTEMGFNLDWLRSDLEMKKDLVAYASDQVKDLNVKLDSDKAKSSKVITWLNDAICFWNTNILGFRQRRAGYQFLPNQDKSCFKDKRDKEKKI